MTCINMHGNRWELPNQSMVIMSKTYRKADGKHDEKLTNSIELVNTSKQTDLIGFRTSVCSQAICRILTDKYNKDDSPHVC